MTTMNQAVTDLNTLQEMVQRYPLGPLHRLLQATIENLTLKIDHLQGLEKFQEVVNPDPDQWITDWDPTIFFTE